MSTLLFYQKPIALNREAHRKLKMRAVNSFAFAANTNSVPLTGNEFAAAARQLPILFVLDAKQQPCPIVLLGLRRDENLFVEVDGRWSGAYIPAYVRRYPFVLADKGTPSDFMVALDETYTGFGTEEDEPLFNEDGSEGVALKRAIEFLNTYLAEAKCTVKFVEELQRLDLLVPQVINVQPKTGVKFTVDGFFVVDEARLAKLDDKQAHSCAAATWAGSTCTCFRSITLPNSLQGSIRAWRPAKRRRDGHVRPPTVCARGGCAGLAVQHYRAAVAGTEMFEAGRFVARSLGQAIKPLLNVYQIPIMTTWTVYIVRCGDDTLYTGIAKDAARRVKEHNSNDGLAASYTRGRRPVVLVYQEAAATRSDALKREFQIKQMSREAKERLLVAVESGS